MTSAPRNGEFQGENYELDLLTLKFFDETFAYMHFSS